MRILAFIGDEDGIKKILKHLGMWAIKARPPQKRANGLPLNIHIDFSNSQIPPSEDYLYCDPDYPLKCMPHNFKKALGSSGPVHPALVNIKEISSTISAWKTPIITFSEHSKPHPRSHNPDTLYVAMHFFWAHKANLPILPPQKRKFLSIF